MDECMLNDLLECSVCLERLDTSSKVLPCQHTFCKKCLEEIVCTHRELRCPECRVLVDAKIDDLPPNVLLMRILEGMRNATPKALKTPLRCNNGPQLVLGTQGAPASTAVPNPLPILAANNPTPRHISSVAKQSIHSYSRPYGLAIYDYISKIPGDLSFKKGDIVLLRKKIDNNWYFGECGPNQGVFPLAYVQVMTPLPPHVPQCKALYDFRMSNNDDDGCLTFNKGEIISVIRRVDENWAEGKLLDRVGIFPLAFVELNSVARALMKFSTNVQPGPSRVAPPTPTNDETTPLIPTDHSKNVEASSQPRPQVIAATALPATDTGSNVSSGGSSTTTTPNTPNSSSTSSSSSTTPSSPSSPSNSPLAVGSSQNVKRHSFTAVNSSHHSHPHHRHSAEILSPPVDPALFEHGNASQTSINNNHNIRHRRSGSSDLVLAQHSQNHPGSTESNLIPVAYVALYPYKPQKSDELELRKGGIYMVTERCQDGWFKGTSNRTQKCGVFPGNYVAPANKCQRGACRSSPNATPQPNLAPTSLQSGNESRLAVATHMKNKNEIIQPYNGRSLPPPELPPRAASPATTLSSSWHGQRQRNHEQNPPPRPSEPPPTVISVAKGHASPANAVSPGKMLTTTTTTTAAAAALSTPSRNPSNLTSPTSTPAAVNNPKSAEKVKEKKDKGVSLMRRLTNIKKSKSPPPSTYSMDNPVFDDGNCSTSSATPVHIRSGSCPSKLLQVGPTKDRSQPGHAGTLQRIKRKEHPSLPVSFAQRSEEAGEVVASGGNQHRKSNSLDGGTGKQVKQLSSRERVYRFRCIVPYPPNSEFELELREGDIVYVSKKFQRDDGWYKGTQQRTGRTGLFPASFVEAF